MKKVRRAFALLLSAALLLGVLEPAAIAAGPVTGANLQTTIQTPRSIEPQKWNLRGKRHLVHFCRGGANYLGDGGHRGL